MALDQKNGNALVERRHPEWREHQKRWRWLQDSLEGGERYRHADYSLDPTRPLPVGYQQWYQVGSNRGRSVACGKSNTDPTTGEIYPFTYGQIVERNLVPHLNEMGEANRDLYTMRLHRTPVPTNVPRAVNSHLGRIYSKEIKRAGPADLEAWWRDIDGRGTPFDRWMQEVVAPLLLVLGQIDMVLDLPKAVSGQSVSTKADTVDLKQDQCKAGLILPENLVWWRKGEYGEYLEALVLERLEGQPFYRHWTPESSDLYDPRGNHVEAGSYEHKLGYVPIVRVFDRKKVRCSNVGHSQYESIAEFQLAIYNGRSELILGDVQQAHSILQGDESYMGQDSEFNLSPGSAFPASKDKAPWSFVDPPKGAQEAVRQHILDYQDEADRDAQLLKPAGMTTGTTVAQSGISKIADQADGNAMLAQRAATLERAELLASRFALAAIRRAKPELIADEIIVQYPKQFDLYAASDLADALDDIQRVIQTAGKLPETETELLQRLAAVALPGLPDERLKVIRDEIALAVKSQAQSQAEAQLA